MEKGDHEEINKRIELIKEIQEFEKKFGFKETRNFKKYDPKKPIYYYYYYTGKITLPYSYEDPKLSVRFGTSMPQTVDPEKYDTFLHKAEAVAGRKIITPSLIKASPERAIMVVIHEDSHEQFNFPSGIEESITTLVGYLGAMEFTKIKYGENSDVYKKLEGELGENLKFAPVFDRYYRLLSKLYTNHQLGRLSEKETLAKKEALLRKKDFLLNNAYIAFRMTYYRYLPLAYEVYLATDRDFIKTIKIFLAIPKKDAPRRNLEKIKKIEKKVEDYLKEIIKSQESLALFSFWACPEPRRRVKLNNDSSLKWES